jgi:hypothetical protein
MHLIDTLKSVWHDWALAPREATTDRPVSEDVRRTIAAAQREAIRRARKSR